MRKALGISALVFVCVLAILLVTLGNRGDTAAPPSEVTTSAADPATPASSTSNAAADGSRPACPVATLAGVTLECLGAQATSAAPTQRTVVTLWAWWCGPCRAELPLFDELAARHPELTVLGVHADRDSQRGIDLLESLNVQLPSLADTDNALAPALGLPNVVPITVLFDENGQMEEFFAVPFENYEDLESAVL